MFLFLAFHQLPLQTKLSKSRVCVQWIVLISDILLSIDGVPLANDGTIHFRNGQRMYLNYLFTHKAVGDSVEADLLRYLFCLFSINRAETARDFRSPFPSFQIKISL